MDGHTTQTRSSEDELREVLKEFRMHNAQMQHENHQLQRRILLLQQQIASLQADRHVQDLATLC